MSDTEPKEDLASLFKKLEEEMKHIKVLDPEKDFPVTIKGVVLMGAAKSHYQEKVAVGTFVSVRPATGDKTYLGIYLGELPVYSGTSCAIDDRTSMLKVGGFIMNPAMFVPDLNKVVYGMESWWGEIKSPEELREITDEDIQNIWYVKAMQQFAIETARMGAQIDRDIQTAGGEK